MLRWLLDFGEWVLAVGRRAKLLLTGGMIVAALEAWQLAGHSLPRKYTWWVLILFGIFAAFDAWRSERSKARDDRPDARIRIPPEPSITDRPSLIRRLVEMRTEHSRVTLDCRENHNRQFGQELSDVFEAAGWMVIPGGTGGRGNAGILGVAGHNKALVERVAEALHKAGVRDIAPNHTPGQVQPGHPKYVYVNNQIEIWIGY